MIFNQLIYRPDSGEILGVHILGLHAADLIHEASNAIAMGNTIKVSAKFHFTRIVCRTLTSNGCDDVVVKSRYRMLRFLLTTHCSVFDRTSNLLCMPIQPCLKCWTSSFSPRRYGF